MRVGIGYDSHRLTTGRPLIIGGVEIPYIKGLLGHSDADVLIHAVCDAILGSIGEGDLGRHFPDRDPLYKDISSIKILETVSELLERKGWAVHNIDATVIMEEPKLMKYIDAMVAVIAESIHVSPYMVNIKATTNEGMGFIGRNEGIAALAVATVKERPSA